MSNVVLRNRIWNKMINAKRMTFYYSHRAEYFQKRHRIWMFGISVMLLLALFIFPIFSGAGVIIASIIIVFASVGELYLLHFAPETNWKAARVMSLQSEKMFEEWRKLWIRFENGKRDKAEFWVEFLESHTKSIGTTVIPYDHDTNDDCHKEAKSVIETEFRATTK